MNRRGTPQWLIPVAVVVVVSGCSGASGPASTALDLAGDALGEIDREEFGERRRVLTADRKTLR